MKIGMLRYAVRKLPADQLPGKKTVNPGNSQYLADLSGKGILAREEDDQTSEAKREPRDVRLQRALVDQLVSRATLCLESVVHPQVGTLEDDPADQGGHGGNVHEPSESHRRARAQDEVSQRQEEDRQGDRVNRHAPPVAPHEYGRRVALLGKTV